MSLSRRKRQESQALIEFALISPVLLLLLFGIIDIGRAVFYYDTLNHAAREGARAAVRASSTLPTNNDVLNAVTQQMVGAPVSEPCPQGPVTSALPPGNTAWMYITEPNPPASIEIQPADERAWRRVRGGLQRLLQRRQSGRRQRAAAGDAALQPDPDHADHRAGDGQSHPDLGVGDLPDRVLMMRQRGQAIVLIALMLGVVVGMAALAIDGSRAYAVRRDLQAAVDAAALAAADNMQQTGSFTQAEQAATTSFGTNLRLYSAPSCSRATERRALRPSRSHAPTRTAPMLTQVVTGAGAAGQPVQPDRGRARSSCSSVAF